MMQIYVCWLSKSLHVSLTPVEDPALENGGLHLFSIHLSGINGSAPWNQLSFGAMPMPYFLTLILISKNRNPGDPGVLFSASIANFEPLWGSDSTCLSSNPWLCGWSVDPMGSKCWNMFKLIRYHSLSLIYVFLRKFCKSLHLASAYSLQPCPVVSIPTEFQAHTPAKNRRNIWNWLGGWSSSLTKENGTLWGPHFYVFLWCFLHFFLIITMIHVKLPHMWVCIIEYPRFLTTAKRDC